MPKEKTAKHTLRLMTYNMQVGIRTRRYGDYFRQGWRHVLPPAHPTRHLEPIVGMLQNHDLVAIQEADAGSYRTRSINLLHYLAERSGYPHWHLHNHRNLAPIARHGMGILSRFPITRIDCHALPGRLPGRGVAIYRFGDGGQLTVVVTHLALSERDRRLQLSHIQNLVEGDEHVILMGDLNCETDELRRHPLFRERGFLHHPEVKPSFPSWQPDRVIDHILVTPGIRILEGGPVDFAFSDHLPISMEVELPEGISLTS